MQAMIAKKSTLGKLAGEMKKYPQVLENERVADKEKVLKDEAVQNAIRQAEERLGASGRVLVRPSGTEPVIRVMAEAESEQLCRECVDGILSEMRKIKN